MRLPKPKTKIDWDAAVDFFFMLVIPGIMVLLFLALIIAGIKDSNKNEKEMIKQQEQQTRLVDKQLRAECESNEGTRVVVLRDTAYCMSGDTELDHWTVVE